MSSTKQGHHILRQGRIAAARVATLKGNAPGRLRMAQVMEACIQMIQAAACMMLVIKDTTGSKNVRPAIWFQSCPEIFSTLFCNQQRGGTREITAPALQQARSRYCPTRLMTVRATIFSPHREGPQSLSPRSLVKHCKARTKRATRHSCRAVPASSSRSATTSAKRKNKR